MCCGQWGARKCGSGLIERCWGTSRILKERGALKRGGFQAPHPTLKITFLAHKVDTNIKMNRIVYAIILKRINP